MRKRIRLVLLFVCGLTLPVLSFGWTPTISLLGNYTITNNNDVAKSGMFRVQNRNVNFGFELSNKFYLDDHYFIKTGIRYSSFQTTVSGGDQVSARFDAPYQISWQAGYASFAVPVHFGKAFTTQSGTKGDFYAGASVGILMVSGATTSTSTGSSGSVGNPDTITTVFPNFGGPFPTCFLATADLGINYQPFKSAPRLRVGLMCSIQLNKTNPFDYQAAVSDSRGHSFTYDLQHQQQFTNCAFLLSYTFGNLNHEHRPRGGTYYVAPKGL